MADEQEQFLEDFRLVFLERKQLGIGHVASQEFGADMVAGSEGAVRRDR